MSSLLGWSELELEGYTLLHVCIAVMACAVLAKRTRAIFVAIYVLITNISWISLALLWWWFDCTHWPGSVTRSVFTLWRYPTISLLTLVVTWRWSKFWQAENDTGNPLLWFHKFCWYYSLSDFVIFPLLVIVSPLSIIHFNLNVALVEYTVVAWSTCPLLVLTAMLAKRWKPIYKYSNFMSVYAEPTYHHITTTVAVVIIQSLLYGLMTIMLFVEIVDLSVLTSAVLPLFEVVILCTNLYFCKTMIIHDPKILHALTIENDLEVTGLRCKCCGYTEALENKRRMSIEIPPQFTVKSVMDTYDNTDRDNWVTNVLTVKSLNLSDVSVITEESEGEEDYETQIRQFTHNYLEQTDSFSSQRHHRNFSHLSDLSVDYLGPMPDRPRRPSRTATAVDILTLLEDSDSESNISLSVSTI